MSFITHSLNVLFHYLTMQINEIYLIHFMLYEFRKGTSASEAHRKITLVYPNSLSLRIKYEN